LVSLGVVISGILSIGLLKSNYEEGVKENLIENATIIKYFIESENDMIVIDEFLRHLDAEVMNNNMETRITLINREGVVIVDTAISEAELNNHSQRPEIVEAFNGLLELAKGIQIQLTKICIMSLCLYLQKISQSFVCRFLLEILQSTLIKLLVILLLLHLLV